MGHDCVDDGRPVISNNAHRKSDVVKDRQPTITVLSYPTKRERERIGSLLHEIIGARLRGWVWSLPGQAEKVVAITAKVILLWFQDEACYVVRLHARCGLLLHLSHCHPIHTGRGDSTKWYLTPLLL